MDGYRSRLQRRLLFGAAVALAACGHGGGGMPAPTPQPIPAETTHTDVVTYKNDLARSGQNLTESALTPANLSASTFGLQRILSTDGKVDAQPLYLSALTLAGAAHNVAFVATENDTVYAFDADTGATLWQKSLLAAGESAGDDPSCGQIAPTIGVTSTPVINRSAGAHGVIYLVAMSIDSTHTYHQRLHALDVTTGAELSGGPVTIAAVYPAAGGGSVSFDAADYAERAALLLYNGVLYTSWTSHCDDRPYTGWIIAYNATTLAQSAVLNVAPNSAGGGPSIWMAGGGPAVDSAGYIYLLTANGVFDTTLDAQGFPSQGDYGNSFLKISTAGGSLSVADYFTMYNEVDESSSDTDLGSGGARLLPDVQDATGTTRHLVVGAGKDGNLYVVNRDSMGKYQPANNNQQIWQQLAGALSGGVWSTPAYFNGTVYYAPVGGPLMAFALSNAMLGTSPSSQTPTSFAYPGSAPAVSANGSANGIVWAYENSGSGSAVLHAYAAANLANELYNSTQAPNSRDSFGAANKFITPTIADGKVLVGTPSGVAVFGPLN
jgi:hypothetical protein